MIDLWSWLRGLSALWLALVLASGFVAASIRDPAGVAVIIGNRSYGHERVPEVSFPHREADAFPAYVVDVRGFDAANIIDLWDTSEAEMVSTFGIEGNHEGQPWRHRLLIRRGLNALMLDAVPEYGLFGQKTRNAIKDWQDAKGFVETGYHNEVQSLALMAAGREVAVSVTTPALASAPDTDPASSLRSLSELRVAAAVYSRRYQTGDKFRDCMDCPEMVVVAAGSFMMGDLSGDGYRNEQPVHKVSIQKPFAVGVYEVTFAEWDACVLGAGCNGYMPTDRGWGRNLQPVIDVNWEDAKSYVAWLSQTTGQPYRLLSEAEWEYVARAGVVSRYSWGNAVGTNLANCNGCESRWDNKQSAPVGSFASNRFGLHDVHGNVWEWVEDCPGGSYAKVPTDGTAWTENVSCWQHQIRGGSFDDKPEHLRLAKRENARSLSRRNNIGFRVARDVD